ncbi:uncharacterized protein LOC128241109 [Mya arenaria]|uniref:uncharacterized protein LOC128241109 n=1 Tax=Mya arenaria TaxID=6604 RepID=UPI0022E66829|nr:uncharacterized protein LOC128241109 [Mya arenaria]
MGKGKDDVNSGGDFSDSKLLRKLNWDFDPAYEWENGGKDYTLPGEEPKKDTKLERVAKKWQKHAIKIIFVGSFVCMILCCCFACCKRFFSRLCAIGCMWCRDMRDICLNRDPTFQTARRLADDYGIKLDYEQYKKIKNSYEQSLQKQGYGSKIDLSGRGKGKTSMF